MEQISEAGNVEVPAYLALLQLGYQLERRFSENRSEIWIAVNDNLKLSASSPLELLGLHSMRTIRGPEWKAVDQQIDQYLGKYYSERLPQENEEC
jgi:hypothetical protein